VAQRTRARALTAARAQLLAGLASDMTKGVQPFAACRHGWTAASDRAAIVNAPDGVSSAWRPGFRAVSRHGGRAAMRRRPGGTWGKAVPPMLDSGAHSWFGATSRALDRMLDETARAACCAFKHLIALAAEIGSTVSFEPIERTAALIDRLSH
jgi:hypothetical protein